MNKSDIKDYSAGLVKSIKSGKLTLEEAVIESSAATGCTKDFARKILSECLVESGTNPVDDNPDKVQPTPPVRKTPDKSPKRKDDTPPTPKKSFQKHLDEELEKQKANSSVERAIKSSRFIKSGTSNFGSNDDVNGFSFPLVAYMAENYHYDAETDTETDERDYDADQWEYEDAMSDAEALADEMGIGFYPNNTDNYIQSDWAEEPFGVTIRAGYYDGMYIKVLEGPTSWWDSEDEEEVPYDDVQMNDYADKINAYLDKLCKEYGWQKLGVAARFDNGETWYSKIENSRKPIKSMRYNTLSELNNVINILWDINDVARSTCGEEGYQAIKTAITAVQDAWNICKQGMEKKGMDTSVYSSRKPIKSGMTYDQVLDMFTSDGKPWGDYWSMQQDWTAFVDSLERDGEVDYEEARWWDNPCTPKTFDEWVGRSNDDEYDEYYDEGEWDD